MRFGLNLQNYGPLGRRDAIESLADTAQELGYTSVWVSDHILMPDTHPEPYGRLVEALTTLGYIAGRCPDLGLGTSVLVLPQRDPILLAKQTAALHELSGGRFTLGIGVGWVEGEYELLGAPWRTRGKTADEYLEAITELWTSPQPSYDGALVRFRDALFAPQPGPGGVPIVVGGDSDAALRRAARYGSGWQAIHTSPVRIREAVARLAALPGGADLEIQLRIAAHVDGPVPRPVGPCIQGRVDEVRAAVAAYEAAGVDQLIVEFREPDLASVLAQMAEFATAVDLQTADLAGP